MFKGCWNRRPQWTAVTDAVTLRTAKDMVPVYTVETEIHQHAENVRPQVCATKPQRGLTQARGSRQARLPVQKCVKQTASTDLIPPILPTCHVYYAVHAHD